MIKIDIDQVKELMQKILESYGVSKNDSIIVSNSIIDAEISGIESHGLIRLKPYVKRIQEELINPKPNIQIVQDRESLIIVDGDNGLGQVVGNKTLEYCFEKLQSRSVVVASVRNSNHFGTSGYFAKKAAQKGYLAIVASNASPSMAPWGGITSLLGTNPLAVSFPITGSEEFTLDMATSASAKGKIRSSERNGMQIPKGVAIDKGGYDTTDPTTALAGSILPMGQHKGYGLSMCIDVLCAALSSASLSYETESMFNSNEIANIGHFFLLIKIEDLMDVKQFENRMQKWVKQLKEAKLRPGFEEILIPGELESRKLKSSKKSMLINKKTYQEMEAIAEKLGII